ncbi:MAG: response regulator, partial [Comamonadaceae bacterium]
MTEPAATTLVVIDDDPDVLRATARVLRQAGYDVVTGESAAQALELTWRHRPAILLLDVMLPDGNGIDVARQLKSEPALASVFIILFSGLKTSGEDQAAGLDAGLVDGYIARPFSKPEFLARIDAMLRLHAAQESLREALSQIRQIASLVPGLICQYRLRPDGSSYFPFVSKAISEIFRVSPEEVSQDATAVFALLHPEDHDHTIASLRASAKNLSPWCHEFRMKFSDGTVRRLLGNGIPQAESSGGVLWHCFIMDVSERKQLETALLESKESFRIMFHEAPLGIALIDSLNGQFLMVNPMFAKLAGRSMDEMANIDWMSITHPDDLAADVMQFERVLR